MARATKDRRYTRSSREREPRKWARFSGCARRPTVWDGVWRRISRAQVARGRARARSLSLRGLLNLLNPKTKLSRTGGSDHSPSFRCDLRLCGRAVASEEGGSKQDAKERAAASALATITSEPTSPFADRVAEMV